MSLHQFCSDTDLLIEYYLILGRSSNHTHARDELISTIELFFCEREVDGIMPTAFDLRQLLMNEIKLKSCFYNKF